MSGYAKGGQPPAWQPDEFALHSQRWVDPDDAAPTSILLQHATVPFVAYLDSSDEQALQETALQYLQQADERVQLGLPDSWLPGLTQDGPGFRWTPLGTGLVAGPVGSFWSERFDEDETLIDRTLVLVASEFRDERFLGSGFGIRVVAHARARQDDDDEVRITGMSASLPFGVYRFDPGDLPDLDLDSVFDQVADQVSPRLRLRFRSVFSRGFRLGQAPDGTVQIEVRGRGLDGVDDGPLPSTPYEFVALGTLSGSEVHLTSFNRFPLIACAAGDARIFQRDSTSQVGPRDTRKRRPSRRETWRDPAAALDTYREVENITANTDSVLEVPGLLQIVRTWYVLEDHPAGGVKHVQLPGVVPVGPAIRSNDLSAVSAYRNLGELFERLALYGMPAVPYFKIASLPLKGMYRSGVSPGPGKDGQTINASVHPQGWPPGSTGPTNAGARPMLEVHLALGDLTRRARRPWNRVDRSPAEPLGIATDARWVWHEIGHVLLMAALGELEFRFAHSAGDALAAIAADPTSDLVTSEVWRGATFPWVFTPRRHDRCVLHGWSWSGSFHRAVTQVPATKGPRRKGYRSEQILSTSLFRVYRCLGGDTVEAATDEPDRAARKSASDYAIYLIMKAIDILGDPLLAPAARAEDLVHALITADVGTQTFAASSPARVGGCAHKVVRWAFEAQGMYPADAAVINNAPGRPEPVDIYIEDHRPTVEVVGRGSVDHGPGTYVPVSLDWGEHTNAPGVGGAGKPEWFMKDDPPSGGPVTVTVGNRGNQTALSVTVSVWWFLWPDNTDPPPWDVTQWTASGTQPAQDIPAGETRVFGDFALSAAPGRYLVFVQSTCGADRANSDPLQILPGGALSGTGLPCSHLPTPLPDLVAGDNNLGLAVVPVP